MCERGREREKEEAGVSGEEERINLLCFLIFLGEEIKEDILIFAFEKKNEQLKQKSGLVLLHVDNARFKLFSFFFSGSETGSQQRR